MIHGNGNMGNKGRIFYWIEVKNWVEEYSTIFGCTENATDLPKLIEKALFFIYNKERKKPWNYNIIIHIACDRKNNIVYGCD